MSLIQGKLLRRGKVKDVYEVDEGRLLFHFTDRVSAFDVILPSTIPRKGEILCRFAEFWFKILSVPNHMLWVVDRDKVLVKRLDIVPIECVVRGYLYGSLYERVVSGEEALPVKPVLASKLPEPVFDPTTKYEEKDRPITLRETVEKGWLSEEEYEGLKRLSVGLYREMSERVSQAGFIMADVKFEFGRDRDGAVLLADSLGPDEFRLWRREDYVEGKPQEPFDKQLIRDWLIQVGYKKLLDECRSRGLKDPTPPSLPKEVISNLFERYVYTYERISGSRF